MSRKLKTKLPSVEQPREDLNVDDGDPYREFGSLPHEQMEEDGRCVITERERKEDGQSQR